MMVAERLKPCWKGACADETDQCEGEPVRAKGGGCADRERDSFRDGVRRTLVRSDLHAALQSAGATSDPDRGRRRDRVRIDLHPGMDRAPFPVTAAAAAGR